MTEIKNKILKEILHKGHETERTKNFESGIALYKEAIVMNPLNEDAYNRLMLLYRKQKNYKNELAIIKKGISAFEKFYRSKIPKRSKTITDISNKLNRSFGLSDKKGISLYEPEPIAKWKTRKLIVEKKLAAL